MIGRWRVERATEGSVRQNRIFLPNSDMALERRKPILIVLVASGCLSLLPGCAGKRQQGTVSHSNQETCLAFLNDDWRKEGYLSFTARSKWKSSLDGAKLHALQRVQSLLASSLQSSISKTCVESATYRTNREQSRERLQHDCRTESSTNRLDVSPLSKDVAYCLEEKVFFQSRKRRTVYRATSRLKLSEDSFDRYWKALPQLGTTIETK